MKSFKALILLWLLVSGCMQAVQTERLERYDAVPRLNYVMYLYSSGVGERLRTVFLKNPESDVEIVPYSVGIIKTSGTFDDAMAFMRHGISYQSVEVEKVTYKGKLIGHLLTYPAFSAYYNTLERESLVVNLFERDGKVYFSVSERRYFGKGAKMIPALFETGRV